MSIRSSKPSWSAVCSARKKRLPKQWWKKPFSAVQKKPTRSSLRRRNHKNDSKVVNNLIKEAIGTGKNVVEAFENAKLALNAPDTADVMQEVLEMPKSKTLGIFGKEKPAKVRAYYEAPDEKPARAAKKDRSAQTDKPAQKNSKPQKTEKPAPKPKNTVSAPGFDQTEAYIRSILKGLGIAECSMVFTEEEDGVSVELDCGENYGVVIGRRGETLDAIQYLVRLFLNKSNDSYKRVSINIGNYREKREQTLKELAKRQASKVLKYGRNVVLDPMNPYERRIIHTAIQEIEGVDSHSVGSDSERKVVITLAEGFKATHPDSRGGNRGGRGGNRGGNRGGDRNRRPAQV
ncbi:MAG TPA: hypothetical protein DDY98_06505, partial [Ruminococcaceae bacterium]|nr:hypothetical protein [Oscillospiraceae bacterium]